MNAESSKLYVVVYHYVRDLPRTRFPRIKGMMLDEFRRQVAWFCTNFQTTTLEAALEFLKGRYDPPGDMCMFTFDDGLKEHYTDVMPVLQDCNVQGIFGPITSCVEEKVVAPVHMNHFLMAELDFAVYRDAFLNRLRDLAPASYGFAAVDPAVAQASYPLDVQPVACFKYLFNFQLNATIRDVVVRSLFRQFLGSEESFARELYMSWDEIRQLQHAGMLVAGHTHWHRPLSTLSAQELRNDLYASRDLLDRNLEPQHLWPFSYPYGKRNSYNPAAIETLQELGFHCALTTEAGTNVPGSPVFEMQRIDCKGAVEAMQMTLLRSASGARM